MTTRHLVVTDSDIIHSVAFVPGDEQDAVEVVFKASPNTVYRYDGATEKDFIELVTGDSIGSSFHEIFKKPKKRFTKSERPTLKKS